ncbi:MAG: hypothetical protein HOI21_00140 [Bacteroidetes Order II. Incertae sedis bacterium]|mgnify:FL=1|nr:hypothetical protein [Bacteroidetes Order II. bacterium]
MTTIYYDDAYVGTGTDFDTTRKSADIAKLIIKDCWVDIELAEPTAQSLARAESLILSMLDSEYAHALATGEPRNLAESNGFSWDEGIWNMAVHSTAGVLSATDDALAGGLNHRIHGSLSSGLHHATPYAGEGFCTVNGLAIAAYYARHYLGLTKKVFVLDFDAHCGGGTHIFLNEFGMDWVEQYDVSTSPFDFYRPTSPDELIIVDEAEDYLPTITDLLNRVNFDNCGLVLYNAGVDPYPWIDFDTLAEREQIVFNHLRGLGIPTAFVLAGGYTASGYSRNSLAHAHLNTILAANGDTSVGNPDLTLTG